MKEIKKSIEVGGRTLSLSTGILAKQADASILVQYGDTVLLSAFVNKELKDEQKGADFVPLMVDYRERTYAAGRIPGGFFKREGKPRDSEVLTSRLIDRPLRSLFPSNVDRDLMINVVVFSVDKQNRTDVLALIGSSLAVASTDVPFGGPVGAVRIGYVNDEYIVNPTEDEMQETTLDLIVVGTESKITMIEGNASQVPEDVVVKAFEIAGKEIKKIVDLQKSFIKELGIVKKDVPTTEEETEIDNKGNELYKARKDELKKILLIFDKLEREEVLQNFKASLVDIMPDDKDGIKVTAIYERLVQRVFRELILVDGKRCDGRALDEIRDISCVVGILPERIHGSALFTRGQTQSIGVTTLGGTRDEQIIDALAGEYKKRFMLHYNFPSFSVGDIRLNRGPGRREIGHGSLAEKALEKVLPDAQEFPYTIRVVSDILESNGSSSMASVCSGSLALMHAGVPIIKPVAGISIGLIQEGKDSTLLVDIAGLEDHFGDMDFKVAGTDEGITVIQMDLKIDGIEVGLIPSILELAKSSRLKILDKMKAAITVANDKLSSFAPRIEKMVIPQKKIGAVIGQGGKVIKSIMKESGSEIDIKDDGELSITAFDEKGLKVAMEMVKLYIAEAEVGKIYKGKVVRVVDFGAFVEILPGKEGLVHISQLAEQRVEKVSDVISEGEEIFVKVMEIDKLGRINLSKKVADKERNE